MTSAPPARHYWPRFASPAPAPEFWAVVEAQLRTWYPPRSSPTPKPQGQAVLPREGENAGAHAPSSF